MNILMVQEIPFGAAHLYDKLRPLEGTRPNFAKKSGIITTLICAFAGVTYVLFGGSNPWLLIPAALLFLIAWLIGSYLETEVLPGVSSVSYGNVYTVKFRYLGDIGRRLEREWPPLESRILAFNHALREQHSVYQESQRGRRELPEDVAEANSEYWMSERKKLLDEIEELTHAISIERGRRALNAYAKTSGRGFDQTVDLAPEIAMNLMAESERKRLT